MTILQSENFDVGVNGNPVNLANTIFSSDLNAVYTAGIQTGDTGHAALINPAGLGSGHVVNDFAAITTKSMVRFLFRFGELPSIDTIIVRADNGDISTGIKGGDLLITTTGKLRMRNGSTQVAVSTTTLVAGTVYAVEWLTDPVANTQTARLYTTLGATASPVETITGAYTAVEQITQYLVGKSSASTWPSGIVIDGYKRGDDWFASAVADSWDIHFTGAVGSTVSAGGQIAAITGAGPILAVGGPHIDQSVAYYAPQSIENRTMRADFGSGKDGWDRFYFKLEALPDSEAHRVRIWRSANNALTTSFSLVATPSGSNFILQLWAGDNWLTTPDVDTNPPIAESTPMREGIWHRVDCRVSTAVSDPTGVDVEILVFHANGKNLAPNKFDDRLLGFSLIGGRIRALGQTTVNPTDPKVGVFFDEWRAHTVADPGPLDSADQFDAPVGVNWTAWEWDLATQTETPLFPFVLTGGSVTALDLAATTVAGDTVTGGDARFAGDPGVDKILLSWNTDGTSWSEHHRERARLGSASADAVKYPALGNSKVKEGVYRVFQTWGAEIWGSDGDTTWTESRNAAANVGRVFVNYEIESGTSASLLQDQGASGATYRDSWGSGTADKLNTFLTTNNYDNWIATLANKLDDLRDRYGAFVWISITNEPDAFGRSKFPHVNARLAMYRRAHRKLHFALTAAGCTNFEITTPTTILETAKYHQVRHNNSAAVLNANSLLGAGVTENGSSSGRFDPYYQYHPDWKGTITVSGGYWTDAFDPNPADFYSSTETDADGFGTGPILRLAACNSYAFAATVNSGSALPSTLSAMKTGILPQLASYHGNQQKWYTALYGRKFPLVVGEWGYPIWQVGDTTYPKESADYHVDGLLAGFIECGWIGVCNWVQNQDGSAHNGGNVGNWIPIGGKYNMTGKGTASACLNDDPNWGTLAPPFNDARRKAMAAMWGDPAVVLPEPWPDGTVRPLADQSKAN